MVDRERHVLAGPLGPRGDDVDRAAERILDDRLEAGPARERLVERALEPVEAVVVRAGEAEDVRGDRALRIGAQLLRVEPEPGDLALVQRLGLGGIGLAGDVDEALGPVLQQGIELVGVEAERLAGGDCGALRDRRCSAGRRRPSSPARRSRAARRCGRRSCLVPAGTSIVSRCWVIAIAARRSCCAPWSQAARASAITKTNANAVSSRRIRWFACRPLDLRLTCRAARTSSSRDRRPGGRASTSRRPRSARWRRRSRAGSAGARCRPSAGPARG